MLKKGSAAAKAFMSKLRAAKGKKKPATKKYTIKKVGAIFNKTKLNSFTDEKIAKIYSDISNVDYSDMIIDLKNNKAERQSAINYILKNQSQINLFAKETPKKSAAKKRPLKTGQSNREYDMRHQALKAGKRISKEGNKYTENRENRSDKGKLLGIGAISKEALALIKDRSELLNSIKFRQIPEMMQEAKLLKGADKARKLASIKFAKEYIATLKKNITMYKKHI